jgi:hypothetical protein
MPILHVGSWGFLSFSLATNHSSLSSGRVPHPFTPFVKSARVNHHNQHEHLHAHKKHEGCPRFRSLEPGSRGFFPSSPGCPTCRFCMWDLGLAFSFSVILRSACPPSAKRAGGRDEGPQPTYLAAIPNSPVSFPRCLRVSLGSSVSLLEQKNCHPERSPRSEESAFLPRVPHPFTHSVKGARVNHHDQQEHLHAHKKHEGYPGSETRNLGLRTPFSSRSPLATNHSSLPLTSRLSYAPQTTLNTSASSGREGEGQGHYCSWQWLYPLVNGAVALKRASLPLSNPPNQSSPRCYLHMLTAPLLPIR